MKKYNFVYRIYGISGGATITNGTIREISEEKAESKAKSISLLLGQEIRKIEFELSYHDRVQLKIDSGEIKVTDKHRRYYEHRYGMQA